MASCEFSSCNPLGDVARSGTQIIISWRAPFKAGSDIAEYNVYTNATSDTSRAASVSAQTIEGFQVLSTSGTFLTVTFANLLPVTTYAFEVSAVSIAGEGPRSTMAFIMTDVYIPDTIPSDDFALTTGSGGTTDVRIVYIWLPPNANGLPILRYQTKWRCTLDNKCVNGGSPATAAVDGHCSTCDGNKATALTGREVGCRWGSLDANEKTCTDGTPDGVTLYAFTQYQVSVRTENNFSYARPAAGRDDGWSDWSEWQTFQTISQVCCQTTHPLPAHPGLMCSV